MNRIARHALAAVLVSTILTSGAATAGAQDWVINGDFEEQNSTGWTEWQAPWGAGYSYDYAAAGDTFLGASALYLSAASGSFGVYQEICVEPNTPIILDWAWKGVSLGNGWWEVLIVQAPYSYLAVDDPINHPETHTVSKWEVGFGGPYPAPSPGWETGNTEFTPSSDIITLVLKCGSTEGGLVESWFDVVALEQDTTLLEVTAIEPAIGPTAGGDQISVFGRVFPEGSTLSLGDVAVEPTLRLGTCELRGVTPPGEPGSVDVTVETPLGTATLPEGFRYVPPPIVTSIVPDNGRIGGDTEISIIGQYFVSKNPGDITVTIGTRQLKSVDVEDESIITGRTPPGPTGPVRVAVSTPFGEVFLEDAFTYGVIVDLQFLRGDCDGNGSTTGVADALHMLSRNFLDPATFPPGGENCLAACDVNGDGAVSGVGDALELLTNNFIGVVGIPVPFPECGPPALPEDEITGCEKTPAGCEVVKF